MVPDWPHFILVESSLSAQLNARWPYGTLFAGVEFKNHPLAAVALIALHQNLILVLSDKCLTD